jgi:hypothetical protein
VLVHLTGVVDRKKCAWNEEILLAEELLLLEGEHSNVDAEVQTAALCMVVEVTGCMEVVDE